MMLQNSTKQEIRNQVLRKLNGFSGNSKTEADLVIKNKLMSLPVFRNSETLFIYVSRDEEVDTKNIINSVINNKNIVVPRVNNHSLKLYFIKSSSDLRPGYMGILEPESSCRESKINQIDLFIVPGLAFTEKGFRLGRGKGYIDKMLSDTKKPKIGLAYDFQVLPVLPHENYDIPLDLIVTNC